MYIATQQSLSEIIQENLVNDYLSNDTLANGKITLDSVIGLVGASLNPIDVARFTVLKMDFGYSDIKDFLGVKNRSLLEFTVGEFVSTIYFLSNNNTYFCQPFCKKLFQSFLKNPVINESYYQGRLLSKNARVEVETRLGIIDILTDSHLVEVKTIRSAHHALGQVLAYSHALDLPLQPAVVCFGSIGKVNLELLHELFAVHSVKLYVLDGTEECLRYTKQCISQGQESWSTNDAMRCLWEMNHVY